MMNNIYMERKDICLNIDFFLETVEYRFYVSSCLPYKSVRSRFTLVSKSDVKEYKHKCLNLMLWEIKSEFFFFLLGAWEIKSDSQRM